MKQSLFSTTYGRFKLNSVEDVIGKCKLDLFSQSLELILKKKKMSAIMYVPLTYPVNGVERNRKPRTKLSTLGGNHYAATCLCRNSNQSRSESHNPLLSRSNDLQLPISSNKFLNANVLDSVVKKKM